MCVTKNSTHSAESGTEWRLWETATGPTMQTALCHRAKNGNPRKKYQQSERKVPFLIPHGTVNMDSVVNEKVKGDWWRPWPGLWASRRSLSRLSQEEDRLGQFSGCCSFADTWWWPEVLTCWVTPGALSVRLTSLPALLWANSLLRSQNF